MNRISQIEASKLEYAPTCAGINKKLKQKVVPGFFVEHENKMLVDTDHMEWKNLIRKRRNSSLKGNNSGERTDIHKPRIPKPIKPVKLTKPEKPAKPIKPTDPIDIKTIYNKSEKKGIDDLLKESDRANIMEPILKSKKLQNEIEKQDLELKKTAGEVIEYQLGEFLFFGFIEKGFTDLLSISKKIRPIIENLCKENKPKDILKRYDREISSVLEEIKSQQKKDVKKWKEES